MDASSSARQTDEGFVRMQTRLQTPPQLPEMRLWLADDLDLIWRAVERRNGRVGEPIPFWAFAWAGGSAVARHVLDHPEIVAGKRLLDIATGSGLCAITASLAGAETVSAVDIDPLCRAAVALNAAANGVEIGFTLGDLLDSPPPDVDVITAGDIGYERDFAERLLAWLGAAHRQGVTVLIGDPGRRYFPRDDMLLLTRYEIATTRALESSAQKVTGVYTFPDRA